MTTVVEVIKREVSIVETTAPGPQGPPGTGGGGGAVSSVAGRTGDVVLVAADVSDSTTTGRAVLTAADAAAARTAIGTDAAGDARPPTAHTHAIADVSGLSAALAGKADASHTHAIADVSGLSAAIAGKADAAHTHAISDVSGLTAALGAKLDATHEGAGGAVHALATASVAGFMSASDKSKLDGVEAGATANATDAALRDRATHTGTQAASTISDFNASARAQIEAALIAGANITITPAGSGATRTLTISAAAGPNNEPNMGPLDALVAALFAGGQTGAWYDGIDPTQRARNADGSGGQPANGERFAWLNDKSGGGRPLTQSTATSRPLAAAGCVVFQQKDTETVGNPAQFLQAATGTGANMRNTTGFLVCDAAPGTPFGSIPVTGWSQNATSTAWPARYAFVAWRTSTTDAAELVIGDQVYTTAAASITNTTVTAVRIGPAAASNQSMRFMAYAHFNARLSDTQWNELITALRVASGWNGLRRDAVYLLGDSNTEGYRLADARPYAWTLAGLTKARVYNGGVVGTAMTPALDLFASQRPTRQGPARNIFCALLGVNDVTPSTANDFGEIYQYAHWNARRFGWQTLGMTYPLVGGPTGAIATFNVKVRQFESFVYDRLYDVPVEVPEANDPSNGTFWHADGLHLRQTLADKIGERLAFHINEMLALPIVAFSASPRLGSSLSVNFVNGTTGATAYQWDFQNDGVTDSTVAAPSSVAFTGDAYRSVRLTAANATGSSSRVRRFYINTRATPAYVTTNLLAAFIRNTGITESGGFASQWADQSGNGFHLTQGTAANQPAVDGSGRLVFDGSNDRMVTPAMGATNRMSVHMLVQVNTWTSGRRIWDSLVTNARRLSIAAQPLLAAEHANGIVSTQFLTPGTGFMQVYCGSVGENDAVLFPVQGMCEGFEPTLRSWDGATVACSGLTLGSAFDGSAAANVTVAAVLVYSKGLTREQIAQNSVWLAAV